MLMIPCTLSLVSGNIGGEQNEGITQDVEEVAKWAKKNKLKLNVKKQMFLLSRKRRRSEFDGVNVRLYLEAAKLSVSV